MLSLVEELAAYLGCEYISDLHRLTPRDKRRLCEILLRTSPAQWPDAEWLDALEYLTGRRGAGDGQQARQLLLHTLRR